MGAVESRTVWLLGYSLKSVWCDEMIHDKMSEVAVLVLQPKNTEAK